MQKKYPYLAISNSIEPIEKHEGRGRPKRNSEKKIIGFKLLLSIERDQAAIDKFLRRKGRFILATNELDHDRLANIDILIEYKKQQSVEHGF